MLQNITANQIRLALALAWLCIVLLNPQPWLLIVEYGGFAFLGVLGAIFANATGAGGGVVFVPFFNQLDFDSNIIVATSIAIQCCGMTAGALTWWWYYKSEQQHNADWREIGRGLKLSVPFSVLGIWLAQAAQYVAGGVGEAERLHNFFGVFSILLALSIFASIPLLKKETFNQQFDKIDMIALPLIALFGGAITAYLSIGVGELVAVYLIMRRFNVTLAIAVAVILSAFSVWAGVGFHALLLGSVYWPVVLFAGAGAIIGGMLAKYVVLYFSATNLKVFFAGWVLLLGISAMPY